MYKVVDTHLSKVSEKKKRLEELFERIERKQTGVPFVVPCFHDICAIIRKDFIFLYAEEKTHTVFTPASFV